MDGLAEAPTGRKPTVPVWDKSKKRKGGAKKGKTRKLTRGQQQQQQTQKEKVTAAGKSTTTVNSSEGLSTVSHLPFSAFSGFHAASSPTFCLWWNRMSSPVS
ncbi:unnamed protein product [Dibothriocephalus latus]|uniref:Uncharacterized protein n=1 Tax=Dibothriocephalus latus TaxID=60516 RepID=A0A3P7MQ80_DIBLA|nr:unnamed protein product [Dibothriocephalus latus]